MAGLLVALLWLSVVLGNAQPHPAVGAAVSFTGLGQLIEGVQNRYALA